MATTAPNLEGLRVFVSYPRGGLGHTWADAVQSHLESLGAEVWRDEDAIREGNENWYRRIEEGLAKSDVVICIVGLDTEQSDWQTREMLRAVELRKPVVPLRVAKVALPFCLQEKQPVEARPDRGETLRLLAEAVSTTWRESRARAACEDEPPGETEVRAGVPALQRRREIDYLNALIHMDYSDREDLTFPSKAKSAVPTRWPVR
jgi:hypothetical protein